MNCKEVKEALYDFLTHRLKEDDLRKINAHITVCKDCEKDLEELKGTLTLLDKWKLSELSPGFRADVLEALETRTNRKPASVIKRMIEWIRNPQLRRPLQALTVAAMVLLAFTVYRGLSPDVDRTIRDVPSPIKGVKAENPIVVEVKDVNEAFDGLKKIIGFHQGSLVRRRSIEGMMEVTLKLEGELEEKLVGDLIQLGTVHKNKSGFKDGDGNIVVVLRRK